MSVPPTINDASGIIPPAMLVFRDRLLANIDAMIAIAGDPSRLRPHCKTHKTREVVKLQIERGILKHKCATFAEAEMLAEAGVRDICLAYNLVGPNIDRAVAFSSTYPGIDFAATADHADPSGTSETRWPQRDNRSRSCSTSTPDSTARAWVLATRQVHSTG